MIANSIIAAGALFSLAAAVPMQKRGVVWETETAVDVVTVPVTVTSWLEPGETPPSAPEHYGHKHHGGGWGHGPVTSHIQSTVTVPAVPAPSSPVESSPEAPPAPSTYVAPTPSTSTSEYVAPTPTSTYVAPTSTYVAPTSTWTPLETSAAAPPAYSSSAPSSGGSTPSGETYTGDITYYTPGLGSCGITSTSSESIVALPHAMMEAQDGANPNDNPLCGKKITISYGGKEVPATVVDTCPGCEGGSIDLSPTLFSSLAPMTEGRVSDVKWWFDN